MQDHIRDSLNRFEYSQQLRETAVFRILFDGQELSQVVTDLGIHSSYTLSRWVRTYQRKIETGLITLPAMTIQQKQDLQALQQRNSDLEQQFPLCPLALFYLRIIVHQRTI